MKKIMILANSSKGVYGFRNELVTSLLEEYEVLVSVPDEVSTAELAAEGCQIIHTDINRRGVNPVQDLGLVRSYFHLVREYRPDVVLTYTIKPNIYGGLVCRLKKIPYMTTITGLGSGFEKEGLLKKLIVTMYKVALKSAKCIFFQNKENMELFDELKIRGKSAKLVQGSGVNLMVNGFEEYPDEKENIHLLYVGRIMKEKGVLELLKVAEYFKSGKCLKPMEVAKSMEGVKVSDTMLSDELIQKLSFDLLGYCDDDLQTELDEAVSKGYVHQLGFNPNVHDFLKGASAIVLPTYHEGMSNVLQEASAVGRPVIATNISGCKEIFSEGTTGFGCEPKDWESLKDAILKLLTLSNSERRAMGICARAKMEQEFDRKLVVASYIDEIKGCL